MTVNQAIALLVVLLGLVVLGSALLLAHPGQKRAKQLALVIGPAVIAVGLILLVLRP